MPSTQPWPTSMPWLWPMASPQPRLQVLLRLGLMLWLLPSASWARAPDQAVWTPQLLPWPRFSPTLLAYARAPAALPPLRPPPPLPLVILRAWVLFPATVSVRWVRVVPRSSQGSFLSAA
jgi:hypothetical protein